MATTFALVGNPNSGKTTLFNQLTGNHQYVGNWPGVTVERKTGTLKSNSDVEVVDLPGIYSLSPYSNEEIVARDYLASGQANVIVDIVDATNIERNLYLTTQLLEFGMPVVVALNQMDIVRKRGQKIDAESISAALGVPVVEISALRNEGVDRLVEVALQAAQDEPTQRPLIFSAELEDLIAHLEAGLPASVPENLRRFYAVKYLEGDTRVISTMGAIPDIADHERAVEARYGDKADAVLTNERYEAIATMLGNTTEREKKRAFMTERIDRVLLNRVAALPIFAVIIVLIYYIAISTVGTYATDWANDGVFGDGWFLDPVAIVNPDASAQARYDEVTEPYDQAQTAISEYLEAAVKEGVNQELIDMVAVNFLAEPPEDALYSLGIEADEFEADPTSVEAQEALASFEEEAEAARVLAEYSEVDEEEVFETTYIVYIGEDAEELAQDRADELNDQYAKEGRGGAAEAVIYCFNGESLDDETGEMVPEGVQVEAPAEENAFGIWVPGIPALVGPVLEAVDCVPWLYDLIMDGIIAGVGAVLGFVPQIMILFFLLAILEGCGYMARVTFILDRIFRRFGLSGKTFIPMIVGTGCGVPGVMASRTIESESSRHLTVMTTTFMPCSAKLPIIALISTAVFGGVWWVAPLAYFIGISSIVCSGIILKKTKPFRGETTPYIMELPEYRLPRFVDLLRSMWERAWAFIKKAGTIILLATVVVWFLSGYGFYEGQFMWVGEEFMDHSFLAYFGNAFAWLFAPLGFDNWQSASTVVTGLIAKENVISTMAVLFGGEELTWSAAFMNSLGEVTGSALLVPVAAFSFMLFQLLCCPCFAAMGAIKREMGGFNKWFWAAIGWECGWAYAIALIVFQFGRLLTVGMFDLWTLVALVVLVALLYGLFRPTPKDKPPRAPSSEKQTLLGCSESCTGSCKGCPSSSACSAVSKNAVLPVVKPLT